MSSPRFCWFQSRFLVAGSRYLKCAGSLECCGSGGVEVDASHQPRTWRSRSGCSGTGNWELGAGSWAGEPCGVGAKLRYPSKDCRWVSSFRREFVAWPTCPADEALRFRNLDRARPLDELECYEGPLEEAPEEPLVGRRYSTG